MEPVFYSKLIPPLIFFLVFLVTFSLLEIIVIFLLNRIGQANWQFMIDTVIRAKVYHGRLIRWLVIITLMIFVICMLFCTPLLELLVTASNEMRLFAVLLALVMVLIGLINIRKSSPVAIGRKIYHILFFIISFFLYIFILTAAQESYQSYAAYIQTQLIEPTVKTVELVKEEREEDRLLEKFRQQYQEGKCTDADYTKIEGRQVVVKSFVLVASEPALAFSNTPINLEDPKADLKGKKCTDGENTFLLTGHGNWYWITEDTLEYRD
ncbi:hypothetical protein JW752_05520 [Candidatus Peregrinibacteria bacterium]|nr:hypothetical protein [Candidatus Peregrinibacteria bacterium]